MRGSTVDGQSADAAAILGQSLCRQRRIGRRGRWRDGFRTGTVDVASTPGGGGHYLDEWKVALVSLTDEAIGRIKQMITDGELRPGDRLPREQRDRRPAAGERTRLGDRAHG
jgi:hypothetical protein